MTIIFYPRYSSYKEIFLWNFTKVHYHCFSLCLSHTSECSKQLECIRVRLFLRGVKIIHFFLLSVISYKLSTNVKYRYIWLSLRVRIIFEYCKSFLVKLSFLKMKYIYICLYYVNILTHIFFSPKTVVIIRIWT